MRCMKGVLGIFGESSVSRPVLVCMMPIKWSTYLRLNYFGSVRSAFGALLNSVESALYK